MKMKSINFKWNPFTLRGEAPASMRWRSADDDLSFATKEELELIEKSPELKKLKAAMDAGVTKKFQGWSSEKTQLAQTVETLKAKVAELEGGLTDWEQWYLGNKEAIDQLAQGNKGGSKGKGRSGDDGGTGDERYEKLEQAFTQFANEGQKRLRHMQRMLDLSMQLNDLYRSNPKMDGVKVLDIALKKGYSKLTDAYKDDDAYGKEILDQQVEERLKPRLEEEMAKQKTKVETGSGSQPIKFELPKPATSFEAAGQEFLTERAEEAKKA